MKRTWVDRGGTFTDVVCQDATGVRIRKVRSDAARVGELAEGDLVFGTTVATNALLERQGRPTLLVVSAGFEDLHTLRHMARPSLFDPDASWPPPLAQRVVGIPGRISSEGEELLPLELPASWPTGGIEAVAIVLLHGPRNPSHERALRDAITQAHPHLHITMGHEVDTRVGYLARIETTLVEASVHPVLHGAMARDRIPAGAVAMRSDGGLVDASKLRAADAVLSGPAGGVLAVAAIARRAGFPGAIGLDMGGTSTDVCCVLGDRLPRHPGDVPVAGVFIRRPMLEVVTIAAGGGSILAHDGQQLRVGPESAGARPGPQCYGHGGPPTVTDACLALGLLDPDAFDPPLDASAVALPGSAEDFVDVAREHMAAAVRRLCSERGVDPASLALVAYGGAAGQHAAAIAQRLGMTTVLVHPFAAVLSAWGQSLAPLQDSRTQAWWRPLAEVWAELPEAIDVLTRQMAPRTTREVELLLRYQGTEHPLAIPWSDTLAQVQARFEHEHRGLHGYLQDAPVELVDLTVRVSDPPAPAPWGDEDPWHLGDTTVHGPRRIDTATTSIQVPDRWTARCHQGLLRLEHADATPPHAPLTRSPRGVALWSSRFMATATAAGETLARTARSVNIRERRDFSTALFDSQGRLVANAPHIPVHLGAMGETVRDILAHEAVLGDRSWLTNDPGAGGSHLPDLTVVTAVPHDGVTFFVASRGHHVDVGGRTPGSMPPHATSLREEGMVFRRVPLSADDDLEALVADSRQPSTVAADLRAQLAANHHMAQALRQLGSARTLVTWMQHLHEAADEAVHALLPTLTAGQAQDQLGSVPLAVRVQVDDDSLWVDFTGTGGPDAGNLNAPPAVTRAAVLYVLRVLIGDAVPLNEGALGRVRITLPEPSVLCPPPGAAVAGGNVETSQRLVDLLFAALGVRAGSQGTMNNLTLGGEGWSLYETLGGGQGASGKGPGRSGCQVHMTNTRITDPEVLEMRLPVRVCRVALRTGSGGRGQYAGGDGLVRELELRTDGEAALLATRRVSGARGLHGGEAGAPGEDALRIDGQWQPWDGRSTPLAAGDRVRVKTPGGGGWGPSR